MKLHKGDNIKVLSGKDRGKTGKILNIDSVSGKILVEGINLFKKHRRAKRQGEKGEIVTVPRPLHVGKVALLCPSCGKAARVGSRIEGDKKSRYCKKCGSNV